MNDYPLRVKIGAGYFLTAVLWVLSLPFWVLWLLFSELVEWTDRCDRRRFAATISCTECGEDK